MSTLKADAVTAQSTNQDLDLSGNGTGVPDIATGFKVGGTAGLPINNLRVGTDGELITWDASGDPAAVAVGTATHILTSNGAGAAPTFQAAAGGATDINGLSDAITNSSGATIGLGTGALANDDGSANNNTALGKSALNTNENGDLNVAIGYESLTANTSASKVNAVGYQALYTNTTGASNTAFGYQTLYSNTYGENNTAIGEEALYTNTTAENNTAIGHKALKFNSTGAKNVATGGFALNALSTGANNTAVGYGTGDLTTTGDNNTSLGYLAVPTAEGADNEVTLGNGSVSALRCQVQSISSLSDRRDKKSIKELPVGLDFINDLKPVKFVWDMRDGGKVNIQEIGFIAQDLDESQINADAEDYLNLVLKNNPDKLEASYGKLVPILVKAVQELSSEVNYLKEKLNT